MSEELRINRIAEVGALWCDFYHLSTPYTLFLDGQHDVVETYEMFIRKNPFNGGYTLNAGLGIMLDWLRSWKFTDKHLDLLRKYKTKTGQQKFSEDFLNMLKNTPLKVDIDALPEGELIFPNEPFVRITGPSWQCGLLESAFLNGINSSSLIATKTSRIVRSANIDGKIRPVAEFGLRRSNDFMGLIPSRSAIIGGIKKTSNMASTYVDGTEGTGTHPHFYIMHYEDEYEAFKKWLIYNKDDATTLLVDSYNTLEAVKKVIKAHKETGIAVDSIRLDSGDLAYLSKEARKMFDDAGMTNTKIIASNDLDEYSILSLIQEQGAKIDSFGIGTKLVAPSDSSTLGGVYKLKTTNNRDVIKVSDNPIKTTIPGKTEIIRIIEKGEVDKFGGDIIVSADNNLQQEGVLENDIVSINSITEEKRIFEKGTKYYKPIIPVVKNGKIINDLDKKPLSEIAEFANKNLNLLDESHKRFINPHIYVVGIEESLYNERKDMIIKYREI